jgi:hypothetical protein
MKSNLSALFKPEQTEQPVRVIKAGQAGKALGNGHNHSAAAPDAQTKPEVRLIQTGADYCDLEIICGCGESTKVRCWNSPSAN